MEPKKPIDVWRQKLDALQIAEATAAGASQKFELAQQIDEAKAKIAMLETTAGNQTSIVPSAFQEGSSRTVNCASADAIGRGEETTVIAPERVTTPVPTKVDLTFLEYELTESSSGVVVVVCLVTDEASRLRKDIERWKDEIRREPRFLESTRAEARDASLAYFLTQPETRRFVLERIAVASFSLYAAYGPARAIRSLEADEYRRLFVSGPLIHRLRNKKHEVVTVRTPRSDLLGTVVNACRAVGEEQGRTISLPHVRVTSRDPFVDLATVCAEIVARRLAEPESRTAKAETALLGARIVLAVDVVSGEFRTRTENPLA